MCQRPPPPPEHDPMLLLTFRIGNALYALEARRAVEVLPLVALQHVPEAPPGVAGLFNYRGEPILAVDLCQLILGRPARPSLSTRIIVVNTAGATAGRPRLLGLIAERATEILRREERELTQPGRSEGAPYLGPVLMDARGMIRLLQPEYLPLASLTQPLRAQADAAATPEPGSPPAP
ncbi:MAG: chemotaxis protein CheW [Verrucomicrobiae bacterium]|nr:chemotaxis protein CheW [Verrucomicrobiae bacterium]MDW8308610.1 chemotaxis protein CheW [Verrucomicrobiales bacterium]